MSPPNNPLPDILLDTCVIQSFADKHRGQQYSTYLSQLVSQTYALAISEISLYELIQGVSVSKEQQLLQTLEGVKRYTIDQNVLIAAARMRTLCNMENIAREQISDGDRIIAATSVLTGSFILTENLNDFPRPFFVEMERKNIIYDYKNVQRMIPVYLLTPDLLIINFRFQNRPVT
ncbi:hypothetical protein HY950_02905 [Candidatus Gottesmanbacteria bacterium]|nr:hypothetical protein [Candidatus Gottesmanbacteria bacterium]